MDCTGVRCPKFGVVFTSFSGGKLEFTSYGSGCFHSSGQIIATSHDLTPNGGLVRDIPLFQANLGWRNIIPFGQIVVHGFQGLLIPQEILLGGVNRQILRHRFKMDPLDLSKSNFQAKQR